MLLTAATYLCRRGRAMDTPGIHTCRRGLTPLKQSLYLATWLFSLVALSCLVLFVSHLDPVLSAMTYQYRPDPPAAAVPCTFSLEMTLKWAGGSMYSAERGRLLPADKCAL